MPKYLLIAFFVFGAYFSNAQVLINTTLHHDTCLNKRFSIVFYIVLDSNYNVQTATQATLDAIVDTLNKTFKRICVSFQQSRKVFIPHFPYGKWKKGVTEAVVTSNWYTENTINFYIVDSVLDVPSTEKGYAYPPPNPGDKRKDIIVVEQQKFTNDFYYMLHNFGHFFGLTDTYNELMPVPPAPFPPPGTVVSHEYASGSNNTLHGDTVGDTEADPGPNAFEWDGNVPPKRYIRPLDNFMGFLDPIGHRFTQQQYNHMARNIFRKRLYLN